MTRRFVEAMLQLPVSTHLVLSFGQFDLVQLLFVLFLYRPSGIDVPASRFVASENEHSFIYSFLSVNRTLVELHCLSQSSSIGAVCAMEEAF